MKITDVKVFPVWVGSRNQLLVKIETDDGVYGWGESGLSGRELAVIGAINHYREWLIGRDPAALGRSGRRCIAASISKGGASSPPPFPRLTSPCTT